MQKKISRKEKRQNTQGTQSIDNNLKLKLVQPKTDNQTIAFKQFTNNQNLVLHGLPGTGKTFIAMYLALNQVLNFKEQRQVIIVRSSVSTRDMGFQPGNATEKMKHYESPYYNISTELFGRSDAYDIFKNKKQVQFMSTSFIRGLTLDNAVIIIDEAQNMSYQEIRSVITRVGENTRFIVCADTGQDDLTSERYREESGLKKFMSIMKKIDEVSHIEFDEDDIVRSDFIRKYILAEYGKVDISKQIQKLPTFITGNYTL